MTMTRRRLMLAIGAALLVGGWGGTRYAHEQQQTLSIGRGRIASWYDGWERDEGKSLPSKYIYAIGIAGMAIGAGLIGFAVLRHTNRKDE